MRPPVQAELHPGKPAVLESIPEGNHFGVFEDDGETGYFYGLDVRNSDQPVLDPLYIYDADQQASEDLSHEAEIVWSDDRLKAALLIDGQFQAAFDFEHRRAVCRNDFPPADGTFTQTHAWDDTILEAFR